ncbi:MAG: hypothetical protein GWO20_03275 [Candidatus Korarchaeota archaeon]|nr:hypothetical protein [Candidatus Korarchaeota archaeon]NIU82506.1 hypothetical protein [Candidatus Thorarchaeota archaeon]NIW12994.1 hypothetical protein [Candidatus Thorarchaeota archaeon]NIW51144.1 hypothetical protein [Candidatus Korarchaeota archaeon]
MKKAKELSEKLYKEAKEDPNIMGFFFSGSRGKGRANKHSDYDLRMVVKDDVAETYKDTYYPLDDHPQIDLHVFSYSAFKEFAQLGTPKEGFKYSFAHVEALVDKNGKIQELIEEKARIPREKCDAYIAERLDAYLNQVYRSLKCLRDNQPFAARLEAAASIPYFLDVIFAVHDGRVRPYYKYLRWELENYPLAKVPMEATELLASVRNVLDTADVKTQQKLLKLTENLCRKEGYGETLDSWGKDLHWMKTYDRESSAEENEHA